MWASLPIASSPEHCLPSYPVLVHRLASLLRASFRPRLAAGVISPLRFAITSRPSRCEEDLHLLAVGHARHTRNADGCRGVQPSASQCFLLRPPASAAWP